MKSGRVKSFDGTNISYEVLGNPKGIPLMIMNGIGCSKETFWHYIIEYLKDRIMFIKWDYRGHFTSDVPESEENVTMQCNVKDALAVLDELKIKKAVFMGHSMGVQVVLEMGVTHPERCIGLIPCFGAYENPFQTFLNSNLIDLTFDNFHKIFKKFLPHSEKITKTILRLGSKGSLGFNLARLSGMVNFQFVQIHDLKPYLVNLSKVNYPVFLNMAKEMQKHSVKDHLGKIKAPTLIIAGQKDHFTPVKLSYEMNKKIKNSELLVVRNGSHAAMIEQPDLINLRIEKFINERISVV